MNAKRMLRVSMAAMVALITFSSTSWAQPKARPGEIIVKFKETATAAERKAIEDDLGLSQIHRVELIRAQHGRVEVVNVAVHALEKGGEFELADVDLEACRRKLGLKQLLQRGFTGADGEEFEGDWRLGGSAARRLARLGRHAAADPATAASRRQLVTLK